MLRIGVCVFERVRPELGRNLKTKSNGNSKLERERVKEKEYGAQKGAEIENFKKMQHLNDSSKRELPMLEPIDELGYQPKWQYVTRELLKERAKFKNR